MQGYPQQSTLLWKKENMKRKSPIINMHWMNLRMSQLQIKMGRSFTPMKISADCMVTQKRNWQVGIIALSIRVFILHLFSGNFGKLLPREISGKVMCRIKQKVVSISGRKQLLFLCLIIMENLINTFPSGEILRKEKKQKKIYYRHRRDLNRHRKLRIWEIGN